MKEIQLTFPLPNGLHARPACLLQEVCRQFHAAILFINDRNRHQADAKSVLALVASDTAAGDPCRLEIDGPDQDQAWRKLNGFLQKEFPHADDSLPPPTAIANPQSELPHVLKYSNSNCFQGQGLVPGIARGQALVLGKAKPWPQRFAAGKADAKKELRLFRTACHELESELRQKATAATDTNATGILRAHLAIIIDTNFQGRMAALIANKKMAAGRAISNTVTHLTRTLQGSSSIYLRERADDILDLAGQLADKLYPVSTARKPMLLSRATVIVAAALSPSQLLALDRRHLHGLVLGEIGTTSHTAILARSLAIPTVSALTNTQMSISSGEELLVDGSHGLVIKQPDVSLKRYYRLEERKLQLQARQLRCRQKEAVQTTDGQRLEIAANIGSPAELHSAWQNGAEGIGLFRSEMLFLEHDTPPGEDEQFIVYREAARSAKGKTVIIRTLDIGGDKHLPYLAFPEEENPFLGCRAVRFYSEQQDLIKCQLRAILRAARFGRLKIMVPMVTGLEEVRLVRRLLQEASAELQARKTAHQANIELGVMVETPAAALFLGQLGRETDFFSIGSNDLLQYFLAVDRGNAKLKNLFNPLHPAFLNLLQQAAVQARHTKHWLGMCGEMAGNPDFLPLLVGLGLNELSLTSGTIPQMKNRLRQLNAKACRSLLREAIQCASVAEVAELLQRFNNQGLDAPVIAGELICLDSASRSQAEAIKELCDLLELSGRVQDSHALEEVIWQREEVYATDLGFGFAIPHGKSPQVRASSIAFLRPRRPLKWGNGENPPVQAVLLIAIPADGREQEHLKLIARLSRRLMHEDFRTELLAATNVSTVLQALQQCLQES